FERRLEGQSRAEGRKHHLACEAEKIERERTLLTVECAERIVPFGPSRDRASLRKESRNDFGRMAFRSGMLARIELSGRNVHERRHQTAIRGTRMRDKKVRQLHQVTIGVVDQPFAGVTHGDLAYRVVKRDYTIRARHLGP